jgi:hypothetical protein
MNPEWQEPWIEISDPQISAEELAAQVEQRLQQRRAELGPVTRHFPVFQLQAPELESNAGQQSDARYTRLRDALRQLQELPPPPTHAVLAPSPATRLPLVGRFWQLLRSQAHQLVLFYVNRQLAHQAQSNLLAANVLKELSALLLAQQQELDQLRARLEERDQGQEQAGG